MLILSRRLNERIVIDGQIEVQVVEVKGSRVRLAISAPSHVSIRREELSERRPDATFSLLEATQSSTVCRSR